MGLRTSAQRLLAGWAARRPHVLLVTAPGGTAARLAVEAQARALGGVLTGEPADADVLVVAGSPDGELADAVGVLWSQIPAPKVRVDVLDTARAAALLSAGIHRLASTPDAGAESTEQVEPMGEHVHQQEAEMGHEHGGDGGHGHGGHTDAEQGGHEHGGHDHGGMQMPGGLMMADRAPDRDGLKLDVLHVALGPVLPAWPSGLVIDVELQGDVVQGAEVRVLAGAGDAMRFWADGTGVAAGRRRAAAHLDSVGRLLEVAGWSGAADRARGQRDVLLTETGEPVGEAREELRRLRRRVERSWGLRRSLAGLGRLGHGDVSRLGLSGPAARAAERGGDVWARLQTWLVEADLALSSGPVAPAEGPRGRPGRGSDALVAAAAHLMPGLDLGDARLVVASLDPDPDDLHSTGVAGDRDPHSGHGGNGHHDEGPHGMPGGTNHQHDGHVA
ncbi:hypothetical protein [Flexivirga oryzae]|uniref:Uncharacterized protein n=1 Tax=Flexivirga oryzae TaxID=1794944 RepID=A0A839N2W0_9MICO|nr:hypothetical protein [Flexivirga oryzae]MBB2892070.1 hypothetical protein [Flexivirga oryzae]